MKSGTILSDTGMERLILVIERRGLRPKSCLRVAVTRDNCESGRYVFIHSLAERQGHSRSRSTKPFRSSMTLQQRSMHCMLFARRNIGATGRSYFQGSLVFMPLWITGCIGGLL
jgi:hypothetical protein